MLEYGWYFGPIAENVSGLGTRLHVYCKLLLGRHGDLGMRLCYSVKAWRSGYETVLQCEGMEIWVRDCAAV